MQRLTTRFQRTDNMNQINLKKISVAAPLFGSLFLRKPRKLPLDQIKSKGSKMKLKSISLAVFFSIFLAAVSWAVPQSLYPLLDGKTVKVFIAEPKDSTKEHETDPKALKAKIEDALVKRKSIAFEAVKDAQAADLLIETNIQEFMWTEHGPVDMLMGVSTAVIDAMTVREYARIQADMTVTDTKSKKELWKYRVMARVKKSPMTRAESIPLVQQEFARTFAKLCFAKRSTDRP